MQAWRQARHLRRTPPPTCATPAADPRLWPLGTRIRATAIVWLLVFSLGWISTADSANGARAAATFHVSQEAEVLSTALSLLGIGLGALVAGPISESVGRVPVYLVSAAIGLAFTLGAALARSFAAQLACRLLAGLGSAPALSMYGASLSDVFGADERAVVWPLFATAPVLGPVLAPLAGGFVESAAISWRWSYWVALALGLVALGAALVGLPETDAPILQTWAAQAVRRAGGGQHVRGPLEKGRGFGSRLVQNVVRPSRFVVTEPIVVFLGIYLIFIYTVNFTFLNGFDFIFKERYGVSQGVSGLGFAAVAAGSIISVLLTPLYALIHRHCAAKYALPSRREEVQERGRRPRKPERVASSMSLGNLDRVEKQIENFHAPPELRLIPAAIGAPFLCVSLFWLGWTNYSDISPLSGYFAAGVFGYGLMAIFTSIYQYIIDSYEGHAASAIALITTLRYVVSSGLIVATRPMYMGIGVQWTMTLMGVIAALLIPVPFWLLYFGAKVRQKSTVALS